MGRPPPAPTQRSITVQSRSFRRDGWGCGTGAHIENEISSWMSGSGFLDEIIEESTKKNPEFPELVDAAYGVLTWVVSRSA